MFILLIYISVILYYIYKKDEIEGRRIYQDLNYEINQHNWVAACRKITAVIWKYTGKIWNGFSVVYHPESEKLLSKQYNAGGLDNQEHIPVMIIYYHGALPLDLYYLVMESTLNNQQNMIAPCVDRFMFMIPFFNAAIKFWNCISGPRDKIVQSLLKGDVVALSPGGTREALFSENYQLLWGQRAGFADCLISARTELQKISDIKYHQEKLELELASDTESKTSNLIRPRRKFRKIAVLPMFTKNLRSMLDYPFFVKNRFVRFFYEKFKWPVYPMVGFYPVKLTTYIGQPIYITEYDHDPVKLSKRIKILLQKHIHQHADLGQNSPETISQDEIIQVKNNLAKLEKYKKKFVKKFFEKISVKLSDFSRGTGRNLENSEKVDLSESFTDGPDFLSDPGTPVVASRRTSMQVVKPRAQTATNSQNKIKKLFKKRPRSGSLIMETVKTSDPTNLFLNFLNHRGFEIELDRVFWFEFHFKHTQRD